MLARTNYTTCLAVDERQLTFNRAKKSLAAKVLTIVTFLINLMQYGAIQGFGLSAILWILYLRSKQRDYHFAALVTLISTFLFLHYLYFSDLVNNHPFIISSVTFVLLLILLPLAQFFKANGVMRSGRFIPLIRWGLLAFGGSLALIFWFKLGWHLNSPPLLAELYFEIVQGLILLAYLYLLVFTYRSVYQPTVPVHIKLVHGFFICYCIGWISVLIKQYADFDFGNDFTYSIYFQLIPFLGIYLIGYYLIFNRTTYQLLEIDPLAKIVDTQAQQLKTLLTEDKLFLNPDLSLADLAASMHIPARTLSQLLKKELNIGYYDFINHYRLNHFLQLVTANPHLKHEALAISCGFNNKATFYKAFRKRFGTTPKKYLQN